LVYVRKSYAIGFDFIEIRDLLISWLVISIAFSWRGLGNINLFMELFPIILIVVGTAFIFHELAHKFTAQRFGSIAFYRAWYIGLSLAAFLALIGSGIIFAAPGAVYIQNHTSDLRRNGIISIAGPLTNAVLAFLFLIVFFVAAGIQNSFLTLLGQMGFFVNVFLGAFNMLPIFPLDGSKVIRWSWVAWASLFIPLAILAFFPFIM